MTTETVNYINENSFIENLAAIKCSVCKEKQTNAIINRLINVPHVQKKWPALSCENVNRLVSVNCSVGKVMETYFYVIFSMCLTDMNKTSMTSETCLLFMLYVELGFTNT